MKDYRHAVVPAITKELTKMFVTYNVLTLINRLDIPPDATFFRFFLFLKLKFLPDHSFERMSARLCAMEMTPPPAGSESAYAATGDHHLFLLTVNAVLAAAIKDGFIDQVQFQQYDVPAAFLQRELPVPYYGRLPVDLPAPYGSAYVKINRCIYGARISNRIFKEDHTQLLLSLDIPNSKATSASSRSPVPTIPTCSSSSTLMLMTEVLYSPGGQNMMRLFEPSANAIPVLSTPLSWIAT